jgi:hypothetical protein
VPKPTPNTMMIGSMPCRVASEVHVGDRSIAQAKTMLNNDGDTGEYANPGEDKLAEQKRVRVITAEGCKVVGLGYSTCKITTKRDVVEINPRGK